MRSMPRKAANAVVDMHDEIAGGEVFIGAQRGAGDVSFFGRAFARLPERGAVSWPSVRMTSFNCGYSLPALSAPRPMTVSCGAGGGRFSS